MPTTTNNSEKSSRKPLDLALTFVFAVLFVWLRWWSGLWQNRWVGFAFGAVLATVFMARGWGRVNNDIRSRGFHLCLSIFCFLAGIAMFTSFFRKGSSSDGSSGFVMLSFGVQQAYMYRWVAQQDRLNLTAKG